MGGELESSGGGALLADGGPNYQRGIFVLGLGFLGVFGGFQAAQGLQTSLNAELGFINLACLYGAFTLLCLIAPPLLTSLEEKVGLNVVMFVSGLAYVAMILSNLYTKVWILPISMNILVGVGAPLLWTCQNDYVGRCAYHASEVEGAPPLQTMTAKFNGIFFSVYQFAGMFGNIAASVILLAFGNAQWVKDVLFFVLGGVAVIGGLTFLILPKVPAGNVPLESPSLRATAALALKKFSMRMMVPLIFTNGMTLGFIFGDFPTDIICPVAGPSYTGFAMATFFGVNACTTMVWSSLTGGEKISRRTAYCLATCFEIAFFVVKLTWDRPQNLEKIDGNWVEQTTPAAGDIIAVFALVALFAMGDAFWESGPAGTLQNFFMGTDHILPAMANLKMWQSLGFATQFIIGATLSEYPVLRGSIILGLVFVSITSVLILDRAESIN